MYLANMIACGLPIPLFPYEYVYNLGFANNVTVSYNMLPV
jgi:hypothetical protein